MDKSFFTGLQHIGIPTNTMEDTVKFYTNLGFDIIFEGVIAEGTIKVVFLKLHNLVIEAYENNMASMRNGAIDHIAINVNDIESVFEYIKREKYKLLNDEIQFLPFFDRGVRFFTIEGPNKEKIEFNQIL